MFFLSHCKGEPSVQIYKNFDKDFQNLKRNIEGKLPDWKTIYNIIANKSNNRLFAMYDENMIRDKHVRKTIDRVYKSNKTLYVTGGRVISVLLFKNAMEHLNEYL